MALPMTNEEFVTDHGDTCPICGTENAFDDDTFYVNEKNEGVQPCFCGECGESWNAIWELKGYERVG